MVNAKQTSSGPGYGRKKGDQLSDEAWSANDSLGWLNRLSIELDYSSSFRPSR